MNAKEMALKLWEADRQCRALPRFTKSKIFDLATGYEAQQLLAEHHRKFGAKIIGRKMGMTSRAKMQQMKIAAPIHGFLTDRMQISDGGMLSLESRIQAKVEPEIAFITGKELGGKPSVAEALDGVKWVLAALEIIDSRYENYDFQLPDVVADNCSSAGFVLGAKKLRVGEFRDLENLGILLEINGRPAQFGSSAAILGHPARSLADLVALLHEAGETLPAGSLVLAGGATAAVTLSAGDFVRGCFDQLGTVEFRVAE
jgi:2-oxo-3-hexenedioate decarboxylase